MGSTYEIDRLVLSVETRSNQFERGMTRVEQRTQQTTRHLEQADRNAERLTSSLKGIGEAAPGIAAAGIAVAKYNGQLKEAAARAAWFASKKAALYAAINSGIPALTAAGTALAAAAPYVAAGTAIVGTTKFLLSCAAAADQVDQKLGKIAKLDWTQGPQQSAGNALGGIGVELGRALNRSNLDRTNLQAPTIGTARTEWDRIKRDWGYWWAAQSERMAKDFNAIADNIAHRTTAEGDKYRTAVANADLATADARTRGVANARANGVGGNAWLDNENRSSSRAEVRAAQAKADAEMLATLEQLSRHGAYTENLWSKAEQAAARAARFNRQLEKEANQRVAQDAINANSPLFASDAEKLTSAERATAAYMAETRALEAQAATLGMSKQAAEQWRAMQAGVSIAAIEARQSVLKGNEAFEAATAKAKAAAEANRQLWQSLKSAAASAIESSLSPLEQYVQKLQELENLKANGLLTDALFDKSKNQLTADFRSNQQDAFAARPAAALAGTAAAFSASFGQTPKKNPLEEKQLAAAVESLRVAREQLRAIKEAKDLTAQPIDF